MSYTSIGIQDFCPVGTILAYIGSSTTDPSGWVIANGVQRDNSGGIYNNLINSSIGSGVLNSTYTPINLNAAFLRSTGSQTINSVNYTGQTMKTYQHTAMTHTHPATSTAHNHTTNSTNATDYANTHGIFGVGVINGFSTVPADSISGPENDQVNVKYVFNLDLNNASAQSSTSNNGGSGVETAPFCYGVNWLIKL